jgi:hypothetical protein
MRSPAPCWSGELASEASTPVRNAVTLPGITRSATAVSRAWSIAVPVARSRLGAGAPAGPGSRSSGMITNGPPASWAGVSLTVPTTRTMSGAVADSVSSWTGRVPRMAAADGDASTGTTAPGGSTRPGAAAPIRPAGKGGNGVPATTAA